MYNYESEFSAKIYYFFLYRYYEDHGEYNFFNVFSNSRLLFFLHRIFMYLAFSIAFLHFVSINCSICFTHGTAYQAIIGYIRRTLSYFIVKFDEVFVMIKGSFCSIFMSLSFCYIFRNYFRNMIYDGFFRIFTFINSKIYDTQSVCICATIELSDKWLNWSNSRPFIKNSCSICFIFESENRTIHIYIYIFSVYSSLYTMDNENIRTFTFAIFDEWNIYVKENCLRQWEIYNKKKISRLCQQNLKMIY